MAGETITPNLGLQIPGNNQPNWQVPTNYNWNLLDQLFGGQITAPSLSLINLSVVNFTIPNLGTILKNSFVQEIPTGSGNTYQLSNTASFMVGFYVNGLIQRLGVDYTLNGNIITLTNATSSGDTVYATYFK